MAKTTAPLLGFAASGQIGKTMVYAKWRGVNYARRHVIPANPQTTEQTLTRDIFAGLREMWKRLPTLGTPPWDAFAAGRAFTGMNAFIGENLRVVRGDANFQDFIGSPGARGGVAPTAFSAAPTANPGEINCTFTLPTVPTGWAINGAVALAFEDQAPEAIWAGNFVAGEDVAAPMDTVLLTGATSAVLHVVAGWLRWTKPDGTLAYSVSLSDTATPV